MRNPQYGKSKFTNFISGKGFYVALAVCLVGAAAAAWGAADRTLNDIRQSNDQIISQSSKEEGVSWTFPEPQPTENQTPGIPKSSGSSSSSSLPQSSLTQDAEQQSPSEQPVISPKQQTSAYAWPVKGEIIQPYSNGKLVKNETLKVWRTHDGVDIAAQKDGEVLAVGNGVVATVREDALWGMVVEIEHAGGILSVCSGLAKDVQVKPGDVVKTGQVLGKVGIIPAEQRSPVHIHLAMKKSGQFVDPCSMVK